MKLEKFLTYAKDNGINECQIQFGKSSSLSIGLFDHDIDDYKVTSSQWVLAQGIYKGKMGYASTEKLGKGTFEYLLDQIKKTATYNEKEGEASLFEGSKKYKKYNGYNKALDEASVSEKIALLKRIENAICAYDKRIEKADGVAYSEKTSESYFYNSFGLKLKQKSNYFYISGGAVAKQGEETKTNYEFFLDSDLSKFDETKFVKDVCAKALNKFGGQSCPSGKYKTVLCQDVASALTDYFLSAMIADEVQRHSSFLEGKLGKKIASSKANIDELPLTKNIFFSSFDDEGVACCNKHLVRNGKLITYFYNRETAKKDGVETTGNGSWTGGKIGTGYGNVFVKGGKKSFDELIADIDDGVYITDIAGLGTGMNGNSGDFSCQAEGYTIKNGKIGKPLNLITLSGNLLKMFLDCEGFSNETKLTSSSISIAHMRVKTMSIGGE
jgi:PmbA protein